MRILLPLAVLFAATPAAARDACFERPGQTTPPCTVEPGKLAVEVELVGWQLSRDEDVREDQVDVANTSLRIGVADHAEVAVAWTPYRHLRTRDRRTGASTRAGGVGDVTLAAKRSFGDADAPVAALRGYVTLPVGREGVGQGDWSAGVQVPLSFDLNDRVSLALTPEADAAADQDGHGRHLAWGSAVGVGLTLSERVSLGADLLWLRDDDPAGHTTQATAELSLAAMLGDNAQVDAGVVAGLNRDSPDVAVLVGFSWRR